ncbi:SED5-binding protein 3 [Spathaspora sp. JA1]|nr:SED5-binding protein 3 [Spathaspora sp. JA1]
MSFQPPPNGIFTGNSGYIQPRQPASLPLSRNGSTSDLGTQLQALGLESPRPSFTKKKSKRAVRAYHTEFNSPVGSGNASPNLGYAYPNIPPSTPTNMPYGFTPASPGIGPFTPPMGQQFTPNIQQQHQFTPVQQHQQQAQVPNAADQFHLQDMNQISHAHNLSLQQYRYENQKEYDTPDEQGNTKSFLTFSQTIPPDAGTQFHAVDQATSSSKFMRSTMYFVPESDSIRQATKLPVAVTIRPFAPLLPTEDPVPVVDFSQRNDFVPQPAGKNKTELDPLSIGPLRCRRCRSYINPSMQFSQNQRFACNICQFPNNHVPEEYASVLDTHGYRADKFIRPELHRSVYDIIVPKEYNFGGPEKESQPLHVAFLIDITENSIKQGLPLVLADAIRVALFGTEDSESENGNLSGMGISIKPKTKISLIAYDKRLHFFNLSPQLESTQIITSSDLDDPFVPFDEGLFVDPQESRALIEDALNYLERLSSFERVADPEPCFAAACRTISMCLEPYGGGKIISTLCNIPSWGPGGLKFKDNQAVGRAAAGGSVESEAKLYLPDNTYYKSMAKDFVEKNIGLDVHVISPTPVDLSNVGWLASITGGNLSRWPNFNMERDARALTARIVNSYKSTMGYQGQLKLRCSSGLQVSQYYGTSSSIAEANTVTGTVQDPLIPILTKDQTFTVLFEYDGKLSTKLDCHFQAALLYTDVYGVRKVRVMNLVLAVTERLEDAFHFCDENAVVTTIVRDTLSFIGKQPLNELRESLNLKLVQVFTQYRAMNEFGHNAARSLSNSLLFPDSLKHLPMYLLSFLKTNALRTSSGVSADSRLADIYNMLNMPVEKLMYHLYPALVELHSLQPHEGIVDPQTGFVSLPVYKDLSARNLDRGVYLLCDGVKVYVWVDPEANIMLLKDLFGENIESGKEIDPLMDELPHLNTEISNQARTLIKYFQTNIIGLDSLGSAGIQIVRRTIDGAEFAFRELLMEDSLGGAIKATSGPSFVEYLTNLHKAVKVQLETDKAAQTVRQSISHVEHKDETLAQRLLHF